MSTPKSNPVRESMLQLMQNAGIAYEIDGHDGMHENNDNDDGSLPSVPSSSNLSGYFHEELPPGYMLKTGEVAAEPHAEDPVSSPSSVLYGPTVDDNNNCTDDGLGTLMEGSAEYSLDATSASSSTTNLKGKKAEAPPSPLMMPHLLAAKGSSAVSASKISDKTKSSKTPNSSSIRVNSKLSKEMYKDAIKAATRGSLRRLLDSDNQRHQEMKDEHLDQSSSPPIFHVVPKHKNISRDIDASSTVSSITDTFAFSSVYGDDDDDDDAEDDHKNMETKMHMSAIEEMAGKSSSPPPTSMDQSAHNDDKQNETSTSSYHPWVITPSKANSKTANNQQSNDQDSTHRAFDPSSHPVPPVTTSYSHSSSTHSSTYNSYFTAMEDDDMRKANSSAATNAMKYRDEKFEKGSALGMVDYEVGENSEYTGEEEENTVDVEEGQSMADISYGWSETKVTYDLNEKDKNEAGKVMMGAAHTVGKAQPKTSEQMVDIECGGKNQKQNQDDNESPIYTCVPEGSAAKKDYDEFSDEHTYDYSNADGNSNNDQSKSFKQKVLHYKNRQNNKRRRFMMIGAVGIVAILGTIVGILMGGQNGGTNENNDPNRGGNQNPNEKIPGIGTTTTTIPPSSSTVSTEPTTPAQVIPPVDFTNTTSPTKSPTTTTPEIPSASPTTSQPTTSPSSTPTSSPTTPQPTNAPSTVPTSSAVPSSSPTTPEELQRRNDMTAAAVGISGATTIADTTTPQYKALEWMIRDDELQLDASSSNFVQRYSMSTFYFATTEGGGPNRRSLTSVPDVWAKCGADPLSSFCPDESQRFLSSNNECDWFGITCNENGEIVEIRLKENGLSGTSLPKEIASMSSLEYLHLGKNGISGIIPTEFGQLTNLDSLYLNNNNIVGTIPTSFGNLNQLFLFSVGNNAMNGTIPGEIFHPTLKHLDIDNNNFHGSLPDEMFTSSLDLMNIDMGGNDFGGTIPTGFGNLTNMRLLHVNNNNFVGPLPSEMFASPHLNTLDCSANGLNGSLPDALYQATSMRVLHLASNEFSGEISTKIGDLEDLSKLNLRSNKFEGAIPSTLGLLGEMQSMDLSYNLFSGSMPEDVCTMKDSSVIFFDLVSDCDGDPAAVSCDCCSSCEVGYGV